MLLESTELSQEERELLRAGAVNRGSLSLFRRSDTRGPAVRTPTKKFFDPRDPHCAQRYIDALRRLVELSLFRPATAEQYELTNQGWEIAAKAGK